MDFIRHFAFLETQFPKTDVSVVLPLQMIANIVAITRIAIIILYISVILNQDDEISKTFLEKKYSNIKTSKNWKSFQ